MHRLYQIFIDRLSDSRDIAAFKECMVEISRAFDLSYFAYLSMPRRMHSAPELISNYPDAWTAHYLKRKYQTVDPVILQATDNTEPFDWGLKPGKQVLSVPQREMFEEAAVHGIRLGFTIPIHDGKGPMAAVTFASEERHSLEFSRRIAEYGRVLQLMAICFHAHARHKLIPNRVVDGVPLSPREFECLEWSARGKTAWEIGRILGISRRTAAFHLDNARERLGVSSIRQAIARLIESRSRQ